VYKKLEAENQGWRCGSSQDNQNSHAQEDALDLELMWLLGRLQPDFKTIADFRKDNSKAIQQVCREFADICRWLDQFAKSMVALDGSKFKAVNSKQNNDTQASMKRRIARVEKHIEDYLKAVADKDSNDDGVDEAEHCRVIGRVQRSNCCRYRV
jgi:hypothetical protein